MAFSQQIELDCAPGVTRPSDLIVDVIEGTPLPRREPTSRMFGEWIWDYSDIPSCSWSEALPVIGKRIVALYHNGRIRYGAPAVHG